MASLSDRCLDQPPLYPLTEANRVLKGFQNMFGRVGLASLALLIWLAGFLNYKPITDFPQVKLQSLEWEMQVREGDWFLNHTANLANGEPSQKEWVWNLAGKEA